jgi:DNA modification methylase
MDTREEYLIGFSEGKYKYLSTKPKIAGSGCNFQHHCNKAIFIGIDYKFNDFIQAVHRIYRFMQTKEVEIHIIFTDAEEDIYTALELKWNNHLKLQNQMTDIIKNNGLNSELYNSDLKRQMFKKRQEYKSENFTAINNDNVAEMPNIEDNSIGLICTSIPFGNHYEYSDNYNCFGHNETNEGFFEQMDFLTPHLYRALMPGRICAVHVKDRIRYSYMNGTGFTSIEPFSDHTNLHFLKHGFHLIGRITITTDVVQENNQTYRLGWSEKCKDGTKMGVGLPEYVLIFRKQPTESNNAYADLPVTHTKEDYSRSRWQLDAHSYWKSTNNRLFSSDDLRQMDLSQILKLWKTLEHNTDYDFATHEKICTMLDEMGKLPTTYMAIPPISYNPDVWTDITRMQTLNSAQARRNLTKHICPLQLDLIERIIERYSNNGEVVLDPFGGIMSTPYQAVKMGRKGLGIELNPEYYDDGVKHLRNLEIKKNQLELF